MAVLNEDGHFFSMQFGLEYNRPTTTQIEYFLLQIVLVFKCKVLNYLTHPCPIQRGNHPI